MNIDFNILKKSIGKRLKFEVIYFFNKTPYKDIFYATLIEIFDDYIIVEQFTVDSDDNFENEKIKLIKRKLIKNKFTINTEIPINS